MRLTEQCGIAFAAIKVPDQMNAFGTGDHAFFDFRTKTHLPPFLHFQCIDHLDVVVWLA
jgi:hypothetical protein